MPTGCPWLIVRHGVFHGHVPPAVLSAGSEAMTVALLEQVNAGALEDDGRRATVVTLVAAGVPERRARVAVDDVAAAVVAVAAADD